MQNERRERIRDFIERHGEATTAELTALCAGCSNMTIWRDLQALEEEGAIRRIRGGAIAMRTLHPNEEGLYSQRAKENIAEKRIIAKTALPYVRPGYAVYLDASSTVMALAKLLKDEHYTIITSGANIAIELSKYRSCNVIAIGGQINGNTLSCSGPQAEAMLSAMNIDTAVMATSGFSGANGFTAGMFSEGELKRRVVEKAGKVIMLMDHTKINKSLPFTFCTLQEIDVLITDAPLPAEIEKAAKEHNVEIIVAPPAD